MELTVRVARFMRRLKRHVAIRAGAALRGIVERASALAGDAAGLPVVVIVEAAEPAEVVYRYVEMHFVTRGTELGRVLLHKRLQKRFAVRRGV